MTDVFEKLVLAEKDRYKYIIDKLTTMEFITCEEFDKKLDLDLNDGCSWVESMTNQTYFRDWYINKCGFAVLTQEFVQACAEKFKDRHILEVMAGSGYFSYGLKKFGAKNVIATDTNEWAMDAKRMRSNKFKNWSTPYMPIEQLDAVEAIKKYPDTDLVIMSWPPYTEHSGYEVAKACEERGLELLYIGEDQGGCTADDDFFDLVYQYETTLLFRDYFRQFQGIHDTPWLINFKEKDKSYEVVTNKDV